MLTTELRPQALCSWEGLLLCRRKKKNRKLFSEECFVWNIIIIINFYTTTICKRQAFRCGLQSNVDRGCFFSRGIQCCNASSARSLLSSYPGGVCWLGYAVAHTRQEGGPLPTQWSPSPATKFYFQLTPIEFQEGVLNPGPLEPVDSKSNCYNH